jgi:hypothetical protein
VFSLQVVLKLFGAFLNDVAAFDDSIKIVEAIDRAVKIACVGAQRVLRSGVHDLKFMIIGGFNYLNRK